MIMKKNIILILILCTVKGLTAQNIGIGTATPAYKLDVKNGSINTDSVYRIGGSTVLSVKGTENTFIGIGSGTAITSGSVNAATGFNALASNTTGSYNAAFGHNALFSNSFGSANVANGYATLFSNTTGSNNTAIGSTALPANTIGENNTATGSQALYSNTEGYDNTATGYLALSNNSTGYSNTAVGRAALLLNTTGYENTASGRAALVSNTTGYNNTANGNYSLYYNTTGINNTAVGYEALNYNITGLYNTVVGARALESTPNSWYNTAIGYEAGIGYNLGYNNTLIGAGANVNFSGQYNSIAIGLGASCPDNSTVRIGNSANWSYGGYANWTNISDERFKKNIKENVKGIDFIMKLKPVTYQMNVTELSKKLNEFSNRQPDESMKKAIAEKEQMWWTGFLAQDVEDAAKQSGFEFSGVDKPRNTDGLYGLRYAEFVVPLVKGMQEQQQMILAFQKVNEEQNTMIENQNAKIEELKKQNGLLLKRLEIVENKK
jgi:trimeric autotransporter adhesin